MAYDQNGALGAVNPQGFGPGIAFDDAPRPLGETTYDPFTGTTRTYDAESGQTRVHNPLTGQTQTYDPATGQLTAFDSFTGDITITTHDSETGVTTTVNPVTGVTRTYDPSTGQSAAVDGLSGQTTVYDTVTGETTTYDPESGETVTFNPMTGATSTYIDSAHVTTNLMHTEIRDDIVNSTDTAPGLHTGMVGDFDQMPGPTTVYDPIADQTTYFDSAADDPAYAYPAGEQAYPVAQHHDPMGSDAHHSGAYDSGEIDSGKIDEPLSVDWTDTAFDWQDNAEDPAEMQLPDPGDAPYEDNSVEPSAFETTEDPFDIAQPDDDDVGGWAVDDDTAYSIDDYIPTDSAELFDNLF
jgi:hypothetical protein